jgi:hypothetical protein
MCLEIVASIAPDAKDRISAKRLSEPTGLAITSCKKGGAPSLHFAVSGGCSCEFLSDDAEFESELWALEPTHLPALARGIRALANESKSFSFSASWLNGEHPQRIEKVSGSKLATLVDENKVGNNVLYVVG